MRSMLVLRNSTAANLEKLEGVVSSSFVKRSSLIASTQELRSDLIALVDNAAHQERSLRKGAAAALTATEGLLNGLSNKLYSMSDFKSDYAIATKAFSSLSTELSVSKSHKQIELPVELPTESISAAPVLEDADSDPKSLTFQEALRSIRESLTTAAKNAVKADADQDTDTNSSAENDKLIATLEKVRGMASTLPSKITGMYSVAKVPIIAIFKVAIGKVIQQAAQRPSAVNRNFTRFHALRRLGLDFVAVDDYLILMNQPVLIVNAKDVMAYLEHVQGESTKAHKDAKSAARASYEARLASLQKRFDSYHSELEALDKTKESLEASLLKAQRMPKRPAETEEQHKDRIARVVAKYKKELSEFVTSSSRTKAELRARYADVSDVADPSELPAALKGILSVKKSVAVDTSYLEADSLRMKGKKHLGAANEKQYAHLLLESLNESLPVKYTFVSEVPIRNPKNTNLIMFWIMPKSIMEALNKQGWSNLLSWNLAFNSSMDEDAEAIVKKRSTGDKFRKLTK